MWGAGPGTQDRGSSGTGKRLAYLARAPLGPLRRRGMATAAGEAAGIGARYSALRRERVEGLSLTFKAHGEATEENGGTGAGLTAHGAGWPLRAGDRLRLLECVSNSARELRPLGPAPSLPIPWLHLSSQLSPPPPPTYFLGSASSQDILLIIL